MTRIGTAASVALVIGTIGSQAQAKEAVLRLETITMADFERTKVLGTGCSWSKKADRSILFAATDDIAVIKPGRKAVKLKPHPVARDMFPFTYDRWVASGIEVQIVETGRTKVIGTEVQKTPATLRVTINGKTRRMGGVLDCGS